MRILGTSSSIFLLIIPSSSVDMSPARRRRHAILLREAEVDWLAGLRNHLAHAQHLDSGTVENHTCVARVFLRYLAKQNIPVQSVTPADLKHYLRWQRREYRSRHGRSPHDENHWRSYYTAPIHHLLRVAQGEWPPAPGFKRNLEALRVALRREGLAEATVRNSLKHASRFLSYLTEHGVRPEQATPANVDWFLESGLQVYRGTVQGTASRERKWRRRYRRAIHRLLECVQGEWPPPSPSKALLKAFQAYLVGRGIQDREVHSRHARLFVEYLEAHELDPARVQPVDVTDYLRIALKLSKRHHPNLVTNRQHWLRSGRRTVNAILRFVQGEWPPGSRPSPLLVRFKEHLEERRYSSSLMPMAVAAVNQFLRYLHGIGKTVEAARPADLAGFVKEKRKQYEKRHGAPPPREPKWRYGYTGPIHRMLRLVDPEWPRPDPPRNESERFQREVLEGYGHWLTDDHGLSEATLQKNSDSARRFFSWLQASGPSTLMDLTVAHIDAYLAWRLASLRRTTRSGVCNRLRSFLRYLHYKNLIPRDLVPAVTGPRVYRFEDIPRALSEEQVEAVLRCTRQDLRPIGLRDYAMLHLLATYGLRAGEVLNLRLQDIDWRAERLRIRHSKTGYETFLPLVAPVGKALLTYLRKGRPKTALRQVFLQAIAPYQPFKRAGSLGTIIHYRLQKAGVKPKGHQGAHAFRFARAHSLLCAFVPSKIIGDLLGHRGPDSTAVYLKLVTEDLRAIGLDLPVGAATNAELAR